MWLIFLEAGIAAGLLIAIVIWTMSSRYEHGSESLVEDLPDGVKDHEPD